MNWSRRISSRERAQLPEIERSVAELEKRSDAEIVPVLVSESHDYAFYEFRAAVLLGLLAFLATLIWLEPIEAFLRTSFWDYHPSYLVMSCGGLAFTVMLIVYLLVNVPVLDRLVIPRRIMARRVHERALRAFAESLVSHTDNRLGLLVFVSLLEQRVELLADIGLAQRISQDSWQQIVVRMKRELKKKGLSDGLRLGIEQAGAVLVDNFPRSRERENHLADRVTVLER